MAHSPSAAGHSHADPGPADLLDLDAVVLHDYWTAALDLVAAAADPAPARLLDLGAGTGTGALGLADRFPAAEVLAVDVSADSLHRLERTARDRGLAARVRTVAADLDAGWPDLGPLDLTWASMALHHLADPGRVLADLRAATRPGGLVAVAEFPRALRFLPDELGVGRPGFEDRAAGLLDAARAAALPAVGSAWAPLLAGAGWTVVAEREFRIDLDPPEHPDAGRYAHGWFARVAPGLGDRLDPDDRATLAALLEPGGRHALLRRTDLRLRGVRTVTLGRRG